MSSYQNVYGETLSSCSSSGMAKTGYTRTGYCVDRNDDNGSHHICIDLSSTTGGNFCDVTGQSDWCSSEMACHDDADSNCPVEHWCVCQWAFASYIQNAGGCDAIQDVVCDAINIQALLAYQQQASTSKYKNALNCLVERCGIDESNISTSSGDLINYRKQFVNNNLSSWLIFATSFVLLSVGLIARKKRQRSIGNNDSLNSEILQSPKDY